jgi:hypothetical protein
MTLATAVQKNLLVDVTPASPLKIDKNPNYRAGLAADEAAKVKNNKKVFPHQRH